LEVELELADLVVVAKKETTVILVEVMVVVDVEVGASARLESGVEVAAEVSVDVERSGKAVTVATGPAGPCSTQSS
jgi:hypothetical protein